MLLILEKKWTSEHLAINKCFTSNWFVCNYLDLWVVLSCKVMLLYQEFGNIIMLRWFVRFRNWIHCSDASRSSCCFLSSIAKTVISRETPAVFIEFLMNDSVFLSALLIASNHPSHETVLVLIQMCITDWSYFHFWLKFYFLLFLWFDLSSPCVFRPKWLGSAF